MNSLRKAVLGLVATSVLVAGCSNNSGSEAAMSKKATPRYVAMKVGGDTVLKDTQAGLSWTNSDNGCKPIGSGSQSEVTKAATGFCSNLSFGGHSDWRLGTVAEVTTLEKQTDAQGLALFYKNPMCQLVFAKKGNTLTSVSTTNNSPVARITGYNIPAGTRCVRSGS